MVNLKLLATINKIDLKQKTVGDYFNNISVEILSSGQLNAIPDYTLASPSIKIGANGAITPNYRWRLKSGYIIDQGSNTNKVFTSITFQEYVEYNEKNQVAGWPSNLIEPRIIDKNPFMEFYYYDGLNKAEKLYTLGEINKMIEDGTLETVFKKLK